MIQLFTITPDSTPFDQKWLKTKIQQRALKLGELLVLLRWSY